MGNSESKPEVTEKVPVFKSKYNWILSYPMRRYESVEDKLLVSTASEEVTKTYVDLRVNCPPVLDVGNIPLHAIASVCSLLNYQLNRNKLNTFPPSRMFIYHNCSFFENVQSLLSFEVIFKAIEKFGFCSEVDFRFNSNNLEQPPSSKHYEVAEAYKFISVFKVPNSIDVIKKLLFLEMPVLVGLVLYTDLNKIVDKLWTPEETDRKLGGATAVLVGYSDDQQCFFAKFAYGRQFGISGYVLLPYEYVADPLLAPELFYLDLKKNRIEGYLNQRQQTIDLQKKASSSHSQEYNTFASLF